VPEKDNKGRHTNNPQLDAIHSD